MKKTYKKPLIVLHLFLDQDIVTFSWDHEPEDPGEEEPYGTNPGLSDA